jgi:predicted RNA-binding Zn ribbon-like protein
MAAVATPETKGRTEAPRLGDHLALDLLNTEARVHGHAFDFWTSNQDVLRWLAQNGVAPPGKPSAPADLLLQGRKLRDVVRDLVEARSQGVRMDVDALNPFLHAYVTSPHLQRDGEGNLVMTRVARGDTAAFLLGPVAEAAAVLLAEGDFDLVRQCEHADCVLWFYDRTKSHKRRWCSMAVCGNRHKAMQFRKRSSGAAPERAPAPARKTSKA